jgi:hypothetical protein
MRIHPAVLVAVIVVVLAGGGAAGAYFFLSGGLAPQARIVEFIGQPKRVLADGDALAAPQDGAALVARLQKGVQVDVAGIIEGGKWAQITLPDKRVAYFSAAGLIAGEAASEAPKDTAPQAASQVAPPISSRVEPSAASEDTPNSTPAANVAVTLDIDQAATVEFDPTADVYTPPKPVPVYIEPNVRAPQKYQVDAGTSVPAIQRSKDGVWVMASTEDGDPAYLLASDLGQPHQGKAVLAPPADGGTGAGSLPDAVDGPATVVTTSSLQVAGQPVTLANITGESGPFAQQLQSIIDGQGGEVHCARQDQAYLCTLPSGIDIALSALYNGGARPTADAPQPYQNQAKAAQAAGRGVWQR